MVMRPVPIRRREERFDCVFMASRMTPNFAAITNTLIRLNMRAGGYRLQENFDGLAALYTFERQDTGRFHDSMTN